jgi:hypothetical protein
MYTWLGLMAASCAENKMTIMMASKSKQFRTNVTAEGRSDCFRRTVW